MTATAVRLSKQTQKAIISYLSTRYREFPMETTRNRLEFIDKALQLETAKRNGMRDDDGFYGDTEIPTVRAPISKLANFLIDLFAGPKLFESVSSDPKNREAARQQNAIIDENAKASNWLRNMVLYFRDVAKYPYAGISCNWEREETMSVISDTTAAGANSSGAAIKRMQRQGNVLSRKDPYNSFYDTTVPLNEVHSRGEFSAEIHRLSQIELYRLITNLRLGDNPIMNEDRIWEKASTTPHHYYRPSIRPEYDKEEVTTGWGNGFFSDVDISPANRKKLKQLGEGALYELVVLNARIIPEMFGMKVPAPDTIQIWKLYILNWDTVLFAQRQSNAHSYLPDIYTQVQEEGIGEQGKSYAELVIPVQNVSTDIMDAHLASFKRMLSDRALYDSSRISSKYIDSDNPAQKIPVKPNLTKGSLSDAYYPIPFRDDAGQSRLNTLAVLGNIANETVGFNRPQQGQFQKGNKTLGEFNEVMNNADDDLRTIAKLVQSVALVPLKVMVKTNILQFQPTQQVVNARGEAIDINPATIREAAMEFKLADGLIDKEELLDLPTANTMLQLVLQLPELAQQYNVVGLIEYIFTSVGFDTAKFSNNGTGGPAAGTPPTPPSQGQQ